MRKVGRELSEVREEKGMIWEREEVVVEEGGEASEGSGRIMPDGRILRRRGTGGRETQ